MTLRWSARAIKRLLTDLRPEILQIEEDPSSPAAATAVAVARKLGIPSVVFSWESLPRNRSFFERRRLARTLREVRGVIGGNRLATNLLAQGARTVPALSLPQTGVTPPPLQEREAHEGLAIGYVGRLVPERGVDLLLRACVQVMGKWTLTIVGTGPEQEVLEELAQRLGLASRIRWFAGLSRAQIGPLWSEIDCLVLPSKATPNWVERHSPVLVDAMARGVAAIVTDTGALPEIVGDAGVIVHDVESMALALQRYLAEPDSCRQAGLACRSRVLARFVDSAIADETLAFWEEVTSQIGPANRQREVFA